MIIKLRVIHKTWEARLLVHKKYKKKYGTDSCAITEMDKRRILFSNKFIDLETIVHELTHAYLHELCIARADIDATALEEVYCELMAKFGNTLLRQAKRVFKQLKQYEVPYEDKP